MIETLGRLGLQALSVRKTGRSRGGPGTTDRSGVASALRAPWPFTARRAGRSIAALLLLALVSLIALAAAPPPVEAQDDAPVRFKRVSTQFIAALGDPKASSGTGAEAWGIWRVDPGPRGVRLSGYPRLEQSGGIAPSKWQFDGGDWWLEEHGLIMEKPDFPLPAGRYVVTGDREVTTVLTVSPADAEGVQRWELANGSTLYDVTHLPCRSARYTPASEAATCSPANASQREFPVTPGALMPTVEGCAKQDYAVLFVIGVEVTE